MRKWSLLRPTLRVVMSPAASSTPRCLLMPKRLMASENLLEFGQGLAVAQEQQIEQAPARGVA